MDTLHSILGKFYFTPHTNAQPTFLQVVGWTTGAENPETKRKYVYVRRVPLKLVHDTTGGKWEFDEDIIKRYAREITEPTHKPDGKLVDGNAIIIDGNHVLRFQSKTVELLDFYFL